MRILRAQLKKECAEGKKIVYQGGGGAGAGAEFLRSNGQNYEPHALSTQAAFSFSYVITCSKTVSKETLSMNSFYKELGTIYTKANTIAKEKCGGWSDFACVCTSAHTYVVTVVKRKYKEVPKWLIQSHCPEKGPLRSPPTVRTTPPAPVS